MSTASTLTVGLGNPGAAYVGTRHNVGFEVVDAVAQHLESRPQRIRVAAKVGVARASNLGWKNRLRMHAEVADGALDGSRIILAKPLTYMNESGRAVAALVRSMKPAAPSFLLLVVHDDLDLSVGALRLSTGGSSGGHKGVQSIIDDLGTQDFLRLRIGIGPNETPDGHRIPAEDFVLKRFLNTERPAISAAVARAVEVIEALLHEGLTSAQRAASR